MVQDDNIVKFQITQIFPAPRYKKGFFCIPFLHMKQDILSYKESKCEV